MPYILSTSLNSKDDNNSFIDISLNKQKGQIYLYGEKHGIKNIIDKEFDLWYMYYHDKNMRHLFVELPYYTAEFLNIWMKSDNDDILDEVYSDWVGTASHAPCIKDFYNHSDDVYRENKMAENFIREFDKLNGESIMGIYGAAHTGLEAKDLTGSVPCMANQLKEHYKDKIYSEDISSFAKEYLYREYWYLESAYDDFMDRPKTGDVLPYNNYPMAIETGQVFVIDYTKKDGSIIRMYYRSDGKNWNSMPATEEFTIEN